MDINILGRSDVFFLLKLVEMGIIGICSQIEPPPRARKKPPSLDRFATACPNGSQTWRAVFIFMEVEMDVKELTRRIHSFVESKCWYAADSKRPQTPRNLSISLAVEAAEILEHFQWQETVKDKEELASEIADVTLYLLQLASVTGIDLEQAVLKKLEVNASRAWDAEDKQG